MSQRELAAAIGNSNGSAHYLLSALLASGLIKVDNFSAAEDKRRCAYILTPQGIAEKAAATSRFLGRKLAEYEALRREIEALQSETVEIYSQPGKICL
jgi:EPS-associated MarR family transcriptional regulator